MSVKNQEARRHPAVIVEVGDLREEIDVALAPLIREIWKAGITTIMSCQETEPGMAWIEFDSLDDMFRFLELVARYEPGVDTLYNRVNYQLTGSMSAPVWEYQLYLMDIGEGQDEQLTGGQACFDATVSVYFPASDIPVLLQRLEEFNNESSS